MSQRAPAPDADWSFGIHAVQALLAMSANRVRRVLIAEGRRGNQAEAVLALARAASIRVERVPRSALSRHASLAGFAANHQGIAAERHAFAFASERDLESRWHTFENPLLVILDGIQDPRNLGACLRTAAAAGADAVLVPKRGSAPLSSVVAKAASGALEHLLVVEVVNLARRLTWLREQGVWLAGGVGNADGVPYTEVDYRRGAGIVVGGEQSGLRRLTRERCDYLVNIPTAAAVSSLNVSVALGVLLFEVQRQRAGIDHGAPKT